MKDNLPQRRQGRKEKDFIKNFWIYLCLAVVAYLSAGCTNTPVDATARIPSHTSAPTFTPFQPLATTAVSPPPTRPTATLHPTPSATPTLSVGPTLSPSPIQAPEITLAFTGVIVPARCVQAAIDTRGDADYIFDEVRSILMEADLAVGTLNATISDSAPRTGCRRTFVLVGGSGNADALQRAGFDLMSAATNHIKNCGFPDCGDRAFFDTLANLRRVGIMPIGAGENLTEALQPVVTTVQGVRFGFVSLGLVEPMAFAGPDTPGIAVLNEENLRQAVSDARAVSDVVIAMPHMGPEDSPVPQEYQREFSRLAVEAGADLVVGNHTHVVQGTQVIDGVQVFYGLGNFVFDQDWDLAHQQGVIALVHFKGTEYQSYELIPTHVDGDGTVHLAGGEEANQILRRIEDASLAPIQP